MISILHYLLDMTQDMKFELLSRHKESILQAQMEALERYGRLRLQVNLDDFMTDINGHDWVFKNKILNQVQMDVVRREEYLESNLIEITNNEVLERITYLTVSFYCLSTEARFIEKNSLRPAQNEIMDS